MDVMSPSHLPSTSTGNNVVRVVKAMIVLAVVGLLISGYSWLHNAGFASGEFCTIDETLNCDVVNKGSYSVMFGVPVAVIGVIGYAFLLIGAVLKWRTPGDRQLTSFLLMASAGGLAFSAYLTGLETFVLHAWCLLCLTSQAAILLLFLAAVSLFLSERQTDQADLEK